MASKLAIRWDPNLIRIIELQKLCDGFEMDGEELIRKIDEVYFLLFVLLKLFMLFRIGLSPINLQKPEAEIIYLLNCPR